VATRRTAILDDGTLAEFLHDTVTARREGRRAGSTGNAVRSGYASGPSVGTTNLILTGGGDLSGGAPSDLIAGIGDGLYVTDVTGLNAGVNAISGDFSVGAVGLRIRDGALAEPVREVTVAGNLVAMLAGVAAVADDARWVPFGGSVLAPTIRVDGMTVSGR
jgi:PmbA protein